MKNFLLSNSNTGNENIENWKEKHIEAAKDVVERIEQLGWTTFEIEWKTPVTGEYAKIIEVVDGKTVFVNDVFKIPTAFKKFTKGV